MAQPSGSSRDGEPASAEPIFERTFAHVSRLLPLALVPLATALLNVSDLLATARMDGFSVRASFPVYRYDLWSFVESPDPGGLSVSVPFGTLESLPVLVPLLGAYVVVSGVFVVVVTAVCSVPLSLLTHAGPIGAVSAAVVAAPLGLAFNVATTLKVAKMAGVETIE